MPFQYRKATSGDATIIAELHARSWQKYYRGIWNDAYLDGPVRTDRLKVWEARMQSPAQSQYIVLAESEKRLAGFTCIFVDDDTQYGTLLDNLHVDSHFQGQGLGRQLMIKAAQLALNHAKSTSMYLWVLEGNHAARGFYECLEGINEETTQMQNPDGSFSSVCRYVWADLKILL